MSALTPRGSTRRWRRLRALVLERDRYRCQFLDPTTQDGRCGAYATHVHHIDARDNGGTDDPANLAAACGPHNLSKGTDPGLEPRQPTPGATPRPTLWSW